MIALDTECCAWLDRPGWQAPPLVCVSVSHGPVSYVIHRSDPELFSVVRAALREGMCGHHVAFDLVVLAAAGFPLEEIFEAYAADRVTCTMSREKLLDIHTGAMATQRKPKGPGYALDVLAKRRLGVDLDKSTVRLRYEEMYNIPVSAWPEAFRLYAATDAEVTHRLYQAQEQAEGAANLADQYRQARGAFWIQLMKTWGTCVDLPRLHELKRKYEAEFAAAGKDLVAAGLAWQEKKGLVCSREEAGKRIIEAYARRGLDYPRAKGGGPCTDQAACEDSHDPALQRLAEYSVLSTKVTKDIPALDRPLIHAGYDSLVETGRTSSFAPNLQNLPKDGGFRQCLIPRPGNVFVCADFSGFELATWAQVCLVLVGWSKMAEALNAGIDPHALIAAELLGWTYERVLEVKKAGESHPDYPTMFTHRQIGKAVNFGAPGGAGIDRLCHQALNSYGVHVEPEMMKRVKYSVWQKRWPECFPFFDRIKFAAEQHGAIEQLYSGRRRGDVGFTDACNGMFQGLAADIFKDAGFALARECYVGVFKGSRIVNEVHDEYVIEVEEAEAMYRAVEIEKLLVSATRPWLPGVKLGVEVTISRRYKGDYV